VKHFRWWAGALSLSCALVGACIQRQPGSATAEEPAAEAEAATEASTPPGEQPTGNYGKVAGDAVLEGTGPCAPCSRMEEALGPGGYVAMRGHGGILARVVVAGRIRIGDAVRQSPAEPAR
jgi:hypothetical protein